MKIFYVLLQFFFPVIFLHSNSVFAADTKQQKPGLHTQYLEVVAENADETVKFYESLGLSFGKKSPEMGQARIAKKIDGTLIGIRPPLAKHEKPIVRTYIAVNDIKSVVAKAKKLGATIAYPPTMQGKWGTFSIVILGNVQHGFWQK